MRAIGGRTERSLPYSHAKASMTACGFRSITLSNTSAGPCGVRSPRSQCRRVAVEKPKRAALERRGGWGEKEKGGGELFLSHASLGAHGFHVDGARTMSAHAALITP